MGYGPLVACRTVTNFSSQRVHCRKRFLRHPVVKSYLQREFPNVFNPTLIELHTSLANRAHLKAYITAAKVDLFPAGAGWKGLVSAFLRLPGLAE
ncbi:hypothetical protein B0H14DRAFT_2339495 [Mycena olivaceomarginata]|nr:hypothetical protein B0H14DRAFT_2339495 [Mycena olivaceomarginata]